MISLQLLLSLLVFCAFTNYMMGQGFDNTTNPQSVRPILEKQLRFPTESPLSIGRV